MSDPMAEIKASFFIECEELLEAMQDGLQAMEDGARDDETVNVVFRAVHSIKGGAGAFGLDSLVAFAHRFETALDEVRSGNLSPDGEALKLFFTCSDMLADLVRESRDELPHDPSASAPILARIDALIGGEPDEEEEEVDFAVTTLSLDLDLGGGDPEGEAEAAGREPFCEITFSPAPGLYGSGNEPLYFLRALRDLGAYSVTCDDSGVPPLEALNPEDSHLSWHITLATGEDEATIRETFDFVEGLCELDITMSGGCDAASGPSTLPDLSMPAQLPSLDDLSGLGADDDDDQPHADTAEPAAQPVQSASDPAAADKNQKSPPRSAPVAPRATVRVDLERIDRLVNLVGELVINQAMLNQSIDAAGLPQNSPVRAGLEEFLQLTRDIQESVMMIRAQPVKSLFQRMGRIVREASGDIGKDVRLHTEGENTEVDKTVIERLADPLTHMIRNAVDHGLESSQERLEAGKSATGNVSLTASHRSGRVVIEVADDGGGINREKVQQIAESKGLIEPDLPLSDSEVDALLFLPGFSTATEVSNLSGRGVGMDVVRSAIQALGGRISITSQRGRGTTFSISLPLTLAVLDGMVVDVAQETLVVPLNTILETLSLTNEEIRVFGPSTHVIKIRDSFVPLLDLGAELGYRAPLDDYVGSVVLLIAQEDGSRAAVVVDRIVDQRQVVIKGLHDSYGRVPGIAAATILGDGQIALILDPVDLIAQATGCTRAAQDQTRKAG